MKRIKRSRQDNNSSQDDLKPIAPADYSFNFIPVLKPSQKIFDVDTTSTSSKPIEYSVNTLSYRFNKRAENFKFERTTPNNNPEKVIQPEPLYIRHQDITFTVINYLQMFFNIIVAVTVLYIFIKVLTVVKQDFRLKAQEHLDILHQEQLTCTKNYVINHCGQDHQVPAIEKMCTEWSFCMHKDLAIAQAKVSAEAIAEIINSFVEPISYKALAFFSLLIFGSLMFSNMAFGLFRRKHNKLAPIRM